MSEAGKKQMPHLQAIVPRKTGDHHDRFAELVVRTQSRVYGYILTLLPNHSDAEEVFQQTSLILWKKWEQFDPDRDFVRWACGIAHFEVLNYIRRSDYRQQHLSEAMMQRLAGERLDLDGPLQDRREALNRCMGKLPEAQRQTFSRCYCGDQTIKEIARDLGQTPNALYMMLRRIRRTLYECVSATVGAEDRS